MAILSGRLAEQMISPANPPSAVAGVPPALPVCTPIIPVTALNGCCVPAPDTKPARRRWSHHRRDSSVAVVLLYAPVTTPLPAPAAAVNPHRVDRKSTRLNSSHLVISYA